MTRSLMATSLVFLGIVAWGCGGSPPQTPVQWKTSKQLPVDFPTDVPIYPSATLETVVSGRGAVVVWHTADQLPAVQAYYTKALNDNGWHVTAYPGVSTWWMGEGGVTVTGTVWGRQVSFNLGEQDGGTTITTLVRGVKKG
jgi:hypothetical protein